MRTPCIEQPRHFLATDILLRTPLCYWHLTPCNGHLFNIGILVWTNFTDTFLLRTTCQTLLLRSHKGRTIGKVIARGFFITFKRWLFIRDFLQVWLGWQCPWWGCYVHKMSVFLTVEKTSWIGIPKKLIFQYKVAAKSPCCPKLFFSHPPLHDFFFRFFPQPLSLF